jgi:hypothetical protein
MTVLAARPLSAFRREGWLSSILLQHLPNFLARAVVNLHQPIVLRMIRCSVAPATLGLVDLGLAQCFALEGVLAVGPLLTNRQKNVLRWTVRGAPNKIGGDQMGDFRCAFPLKAIDGYL